MAHYRYVVVGGGMTADAAVRGIREVDQDGEIAVFGAEAVGPYNRPPLSKGLWKGQPEESIWRRTEDLGVTLHLGRRVVKLDPRGKAVGDDRGNAHTFERLLLATGGTPRRLPYSAGPVIYFRHYDDYRRLRGLAEETLRFAVLGGGFIGTEIAAALKIAGRDPVLIVPEQGLGARVFPAELSRFLVDYYREKGVEVRTGHGVAELEQRGSGLLIRTTAGDEIPADVVVAGIGIQPAVELAVQAGLSVQDGIVVDEQLRTTAPDIYAAGDVANFYSPALGGRTRVEHEDNANTMGRAAGRGMAGTGERYHHLPFFYSDLFDLGYEAVGEVDARLETFADWKELFREGVVYYLKFGRVRGVLLWNTWGQVDAARALIVAPGPFRPADLVGRLPR